MPGCIHLFKHCTEVLRRDGAGQRQLEEGSRTGGGVGRAGGGGGGCL